MNRARLVPMVMLTAGALTLSGAIVWWALTYWQVWTFDYLSLPQAGKCLLADSTICRLATALCTGQHRSPVALYSPTALWVGTLMSLCGMWPIARRQPLSPSRWWPARKAVISEEALYDFESGRRPAAVSSALRGSDPRIEL